MSKIIHSMIRVQDLSHSLKFYAECFGLHPAHRLDFPGFSLVYLRNAENDAEIELTWNKDRTEPYTHGMRGVGFGGWNQYASAVGEAQIGQHPSRGANVLMSSDRSDACGLQRCAHQFGRPLVRSVVNRNQRFPWVYIVSVHRGGPR